MQLDDFQQAARRTAIYADRHRVIYPALGLASEAGEVCGKIKKVLRDRGGDLDQAPVGRSRTSSATCSGTLRCWPPTSASPSMTSRRTISPSSPRGSSAAGSAASGDRR